MTFFLSLSFSQRKKLILLYLLLIYDLKLIDTIFIVILENKLINGSSILVKKNLIFYNIYNNNNLYVYIYIYIYDNNNNLTEQNWDRKRKMENLRFLYLLFLLVRKSPFFSSSSSPFFTSWCCSTVRLIIKLSLN